MADLSGQEGDGQGPSSEAGPHCDAKTVSMRYRSLGLLLLSAAFVPLIIWQIMMYSNNSYRGNYSPPAAMEKLALSNSLEKCKQVGLLAESIMIHRQQGTPISDLMEIFSASDLAQKITIAAYERPGYETKHIRHREIREFQSQIYLQCLK